MMKTVLSRLALLSAIGLLAFAFLLTPQAAFASTTHSQLVQQPHTSVVPNDANNGLQVGVITSAGAVFIRGLNQKGQGVGHCLVINPNDRINVLWNWWWIGTVIIDYYHHSNCNTNNNGTKNYFGVTRVSIPTDAPPSDVVVVNYTP